MTLREKIEGAVFGGIILIGLPALIAAFQPAAG